MERHAGHADVDMTVAADAHRRILTRHPLVARRHVSADLVDASRQIQEDEAAVRVRDGPAHRGAVLRGHGDARERQRF